MDEMRRLDDDSLARALHNYALSPSQFRKMSAEEFCLHMIAGTSQVPEPVKARMRSQEFVKADVAGRTAECTVASPGDIPEILVFVAEGGSWKLDDAATARRRGIPLRK